MHLIQVIPATKLPLGQPQLLTYFSGRPIEPGVLTQIPLGRRKETAVVIDCSQLQSQKAQIKRADFELKNILKILSPVPVLTPDQIELALFLSKYYFAPPGFFIRMMLPEKILPAQEISGAKQTLIIAPTVAKAQNSKKDAVLWHSGLREKEQNEIWQKVKNGQIKTIAGTRSALFLPFSNLKKIIIEDESNPNHRSWDMYPHYRIHEVAQKLAELFCAKLEFKTELPSVELNIKPKFSAVSTKIVDMREQLKSGNFSVFSAPLKISIEKALAKNKPAILFINRRGAANFILCRDCGYVAKCKNCDSPLAYHLINGKPLLFCHKCSAKEEPPTLCPKCQGWRIKTVGSGSQKIELEANKAFPKVNILRLDGDIAPKPKDQEKIISGFVEKKGILIATQIIFSWAEKIGKEMPAVVAMLSADTLLHLPDFRSAEKLFNIASRLKLFSPDELFIQTYDPDNNAIKWSAEGDWKSFYKEEIETRQALDYPPFSQIVKLSFGHRDPKKAGQEAKILVAKLERTNKNTDISISPASPAFIPKQKGKFIWNIILKFKTKSSEFKISNEFLSKRNSLLKYIPSYWDIEVDPEDLL